MKLEESSFYKIKKVMDSMTDEESRRIYMFRLLFSLTGDRRYIYDMIKPMVLKYRDEIDSKTSEAAEDYHLFEEMDLYRFIKRGFERGRDKVILFGAGAFGSEVCYWLSCVGIKVDAFCDNDVNKAGTVKDGIPVIPLSEVFENRQNYLIVISSNLYHNEICEQLTGMGFDRKDIYKYEHNCLLSYFGTSYFDSEIIKPEENEVFIDGGAYCGETALEFSKWCPGYKKIISFEPDRLNYERLNKCIKKNEIRDIVAYCGGLWDREEKLSFERTGDDGTGSRVFDSGSDTIDTYSIDGILNGERVSYIKLDIEGAELRALHGAKKTIKKFKPRLAVCIYHKPEDVLELPFYLIDLVPEYEFTIRHYTTYLYDTVIYAQIRGD